MLGGTEAMSLDILLKISEELQSQPEDLEGLQQSENSSSGPQPSKNNEQRPTQSKEIPSISSGPLGHQSSTSTYHDWF